MSKALTRVGVDATALFGPVTGIGMFTRALVERLVENQTIDLRLVVVSWKAQQLLRSSRSELESESEPRAAQSGEPVLPPGAEWSAVRFPARLAQRSWCYLPWPRVTGLHVMHGPNFVVPPAPGAAELVTVHDLTAWHLPELVDDNSRRYPRLLERAILRGAHIHTVSDFVASEISDQIKVDPSRIHVIPNGYSRPKTDIDVASQRGQDLVGGPYILALGTIEPRKDHASLLAAMPSVWAKFPDITLVVAGADGWGVDAYDQALADNGLEGDPRIRRMGYVSDSDRVALLAGARCLAYPSIYEGFGLPPLEAMAVETPVVATDIGAVREVCADAAVLVTPKDVTALSDGLVAVLASEAKQRSLVTAGLQRVLMFDWDRSVDKMVALYRRLHSGT